MACPKPAPAALVCEETHTPQSDKKESKEKPYLVWKDRKVRLKHEAGYFTLTTTQDTSVISWGTALGVILESSTCLQARNPKQIPQATLTCKWLSWVSQTC